MIERRLLPKVLDSLLRFPVVIGEIQRVPDLFPVLRALVDADRRPGRFLVLRCALAAEPRGVLGSRARNDDGESPQTSDSLRPRGDWSCNAGCPVGSHTEHRCALMGADPCRMSALRRSARIGVVCMLPGPSGGQSAKATRLSDLTRSSWASALRNAEAAMVASGSLSRCRLRIQTTASE